MPTRFYFPLDEAAAVSPAIQGTYGHTNTLRRRLRQTADASTLTTVAYTPDAADHGTDVDAHHRQYVSDAIPSAQTISGTWKSQHQCLEAHANNNLFLTFLIYVVSNDGSTIKETLWAQDRDTLEVATSLTNRLRGGTLISADIEANDRLVVEIGLGGTPGGGGGTQGHNGSIRWGCNASSGDLPEDDTETGTTFRPWIEFSGNLFTTTADLDDTVSFTEATVKSVGKAVAETIAFTEAFVKQVNHTLAETVQFTENLVTSITRTKVVADTISFVENLDTLKIILKAVDDTVSFTEGFAKQINTGLAETVSLTEARLFQVNRAIAETVSLSEAAVKSITKPLADVVSLVENLDTTKVVLRALDDTLSLTEGFATQTNTRLAEAVSLTEARLLAVSRAAADTLGMTEALTKFLTKLRGETVGLTENLGTTEIPAGGPASAPCIRCSVSVRIGIG